MKAEDEGRAAPKIPDTNGTRTRARLGTLGVD